MICDYSLLIHPNPESALHEEAGKLLLEAYDDYARHAKLMTEIHARHRPVEFTNTASSTTYQPYGPSTITTSTSAAPVASTSTSTSAGPSKVASGSGNYLQATSTSSNEIVMLEAVSENVKHVSSTSSSSSGSSISTTSSSIPKKRAAPPVTAAATVSDTMMGQEKSHGVLGASSVGVSSGNGMGLKKVSVPPAQTGTTQAAKKRGLKRL